MVAILTCISHHQESAMPRSLIAILIAAATLESPLTAQVSGNEDTVAVARVRLNPVGPHARRLVGDVVSFGADTIHLVLRGAADTTHVATASLRRIEEFQGRRSNLGRGALIGAMTLGLAGAIVTPLIVDAIGEGAASNQMEAVGLGLAGGAVAGGLVGAAIGALTSRDRWAERPVLNVRAAPTPAGIDVGLAMRLSF
jgi:hypothetical protein